MSSTKPNTAWQVILGTKCARTGAMRNQCAPCAPGGLWFVVTSTPHFSQITPLYLMPLVFTTQALIIFDGAKNFGTKQTVTFRFERTVVDGFGLFDFTERP
jgi:hypothetical protein